jgi:glutathione S-transferase
MKLYYAPQTRAGRVRWLLEEVGAPYDLVRIDLSKGEQKNPDYLKVHPHGRVPTLVDGDVTIFESAAICAYLADKFQEWNFAPPIGTAERALYYQWMFYTMATLEPPIMQIFLNTIMLPEEQRSAAAAEQGRSGFAACAEILEQALKGREFIVGPHFTAADVMVGSTLAWASMMGLFSGYPVLQEYVKRLTQRPAFQRSHAD